MTKQSIIDGRLASSLTLAMFVGALVGPARAGAEEPPAPDHLWTFRDDEPGKAPAGWTFSETHPGGAPGSWTVVADAAAPTPPNFLNLTTHNSGSTYNLAIIEGASFKDLDLRVSVRPNTGEEDQGGGVVWRYKDENNYYICRFNPLESNYRVYKVERGRRIQLQSAQVSTKAGTWYRVRVVMVGNRMTCFLNDKPMLQVTDDTFAEAGRIGLWTKADASSSFDDLAVYTKGLEEADRPVQLNSDIDNGDHDDDDDD